MSVTYKNTLVVMAGLDPMGAKLRALHDALRVMAGLDPAIQARKSVR